MLDSGPLCTLCQNAIHRGGRRCSACHAIMCLDCMEPTGVCIGCADVETRLCPLDVGHPLGAVRLPGVV